MEKHIRRPKKRFPNEVLLKSRIPIYLNQNDYQKLKKICKNENIEISAFVRKLIKNVIDL